MRFANGAIGTVSATTCAFPGLPERIELIGEAGVAVRERGRHENARGRQVEIRRRAIDGAAQADRHLAQDRLRQILGGGELRPF